MSGQQNSGASAPVVIASDQTAIAITPTDGLKNTYSTSVTGFTPATLATDIFVMPGSYTKVVRILEIGVTANRTTSANIDLLLLLRSTGNSGGTGFPLTAIAHDQNNPAATTTAGFYIANPTTGTLIGVIRSQKMFLNAAATGESDTVIWKFGNNPGQALVLRGFAQQLCVNLNGVTVAGGSFDIYIVWTEE